jgi:hypothetical protein
MSGEDEYLELVLKVADIDPVAADYMMGSAMSLRSFNPRPTLIQCFIWSSTPQGLEFWNNLDQRLNWEAKP